MLFVDTIESEIICKPQIESPRRDPNYWSRRRAWWAAEAKRCGCDWPGIARTILAVDDYLAGLRKKRRAAA